MSGRPVSGLQRQVLRLYRDALRVARSKPSEQRTSLEAHIRAELDKYSINPLSSSLACPLPPELLLFFAKPLARKRPLLVRNGPSLFNLCGILWH
mmetsp:Transcript_3588/g.8569  ORF Transcript_3588/g.8569 Transcript_3588/m.8569 type:complete len:95 (+) Transcript_3588:199-483(+)